jgi:hypothetical protein
MDNVIGNNPSGAPNKGPTNSALIMTESEALFVLGKAFSFEDYFTFGQDEVKTFVFDPTALVDTQVVFNPLLFAASSGPVLIDFYAGTDADDDGTVLVPSNRRSGFPAPVSVFRLNPTINDLGTRFAGDSVPATGAGVGNTNGAGNQAGLPFEIDPTLKYAFTITNQDGADTIIQVKNTWFEF